MNYYYCETTSLEAFGEPVNTISNLAFILCGLILIFRNKMKLNPLPYATIFIGVSSFLFHYIPTNFFAALDVFSIILFVIIYNIILTRKVLKYSLIYSVLSSTMILITSYFIGNFLFKTIIGSSGFYIGLVVYMVFTLFLLRKLAHVKVFLFAIIFFTVSIIFRSADTYLCNYILIGTHFIWHILNSLVIYLLIYYVALTNRTSPKKPT